MHPAGGIVADNRVLTGRPAIRVLIADDHALTRQGLRRMLSHYRDIAVVAEASNGQEAVTLFGSAQPDVAILDVRMPGLDGFAATRLIRGRYPDAHIILLTVGGTLDYADRARSVGARRLLYKDASAAEIARAVRALRPAARSRHVARGHAVRDQGSAAATAPRIRLVGAA
jgi:DNA-binding NarL/FixJ family response regulator